MTKPQEVTLTPGTVPPSMEQGVTLCASGVNFAPAALLRLLDMMAENHCNVLMLEAKLESRAHPRANTWPYYTAKQLRRIVNYAESLNIEVIPEVNAPGHMGTWLENYPELQLLNSDGVRQAGRLDISSDAAWEFYRQIIDDYLEVFSSPHFHGGADEYMISSDYGDYPQLTAAAARRYGSKGQPSDLFYAWINRVNRYLNERGRTLRIWNDGLAGKNIEELDSNIIIECWWDQGERAADLAARGHRLINCNNALYLSRSEQQFDPDVAKLRADGFSIHSLANDSGPEQAPPGPALRDAVLGARVSIWPDTAYFQTDNEVLKQVDPLLRYLDDISAGNEPETNAVTNREPPMPKAGEPQVRKIPLLDSLAPGPWRVLPTPDGYYQLIDTGSGQALASVHGARHLGVVSEIGARPSLEAPADMDTDWRAGRVEAWRRNTQKWILAGEDGTDIRLVHALSGLELNTSGNSSDNGYIDLVEGAHLQVEDGLTGALHLPEDPPLNPAGHVQLPPRPPAPGELALYPPRESTITATLKFKSNFQ